MEMGSRRQIFESPAHDYTRRLLSAVPVADPSRRSRRALLDGEIPSPVRAVGDDPAVLPLEEVQPGHFVRRSA